MAEQLVHAALPITSLYLPATHASHGPPLDPTQPMLHRHLVIASLPATELEFDTHCRHTFELSAATAVEYRPLAQSVHAAVPGTVLYLPAAHGAHSPPLAPVYPALHTHAVMRELAAMESELSGQARHVLAKAAPTLPEYFPSAQS